MQIKGKIHCLFEQSGTFKGEFSKLGFEAYDYDLKNDFEQTDYQIDLFTQIETAYNAERKQDENTPTIFDGFSQDDLIMAFFPCIYFTGSTNPRYFTLENTNYNYAHLTLNERFDAIIDRARKRERFYELLYMLCGVCLSRGLRLIIENPWTQPGYLKNNFLKEPDIIDNDRTKRGDFFHKPTGYCFFNCKPTHNFTYAPTPKEEQKRIFYYQGKTRTVARSMITHEYVHNFILDHILGEEVNTNHKQQKELEFC